MGTVAGDVQSWPMSVWVWLINGWRVLTEVVPKLCFNLHAWHHAGIAILRCMYLKKPHMHTTQLQYQTTPQVYYNLPSLKKEVVKYKLGYIE